MGKKTSTYAVYQITAKFEASVDDLWPTLDRVQTIGDGTWSYVSEGTDGDSYYRNVTGAQSNILNVYGTFDENILLLAQTSQGNSYAATACDESGDAVTHTMVAYWASSEDENLSAYQYYFLYEVLDTSLTPNSPEVMSFDVTKANGGGYAEGQLVSLEGRVYAFSKQSSTQLSTAKQSGQNQPSLKGFTSDGKKYQKTSASDGRPDYDSEKNIYFF